LDKLNLNELYAEDIWEHESLKDLIYKFDITSKNNESGVYSEYETYNFSDFAENIIDHKDSSNMISTKYILKNDDNSWKTLV